MTYPQRKSYGYSYKKSSYITYKPNYVHATLAQYKPDLSHYGHSQNSWPESVRIFEMHISTRVKAFLTRPSELPPVEPGFFCWITPVELGFPALLSHSSTIAMTSSIKSLIYKRLHRLHKFDILFIFIQGKKNTIKHE